MKMEAATLVDSAPEVPMVRCITQATTLMICCIRPMWYRAANRAETKMMVGRTAKAKTCSGLVGSPSLPKTTLEPSTEWASRDVIAPAPVCRIAWP